MFWVYLLIAVALFVGLIGWFGRKRGSARGGPSADIDSTVWRTRTQTRGDTDRY
jgi:hypothetical protein